MCNYFSFGVDARIGIDFLSLKATASIKKENSQRSEINACIVVRALKKCSSKLPK